MSVRFFPFLAAVEEFRLGAGKKKVSRIDAFQLEYEHLYVPVRIRIAGTDMLACNRHAHPRIEGIHGPGPNPFPNSHPPCAWMFAPLIHIAATGYLVVKQLGENGSASYQVPYGDRLLFRGIGERVRVDSEIAGASAECDYEELRAEWRAFSRDAAGFIATHVPELSEHKEVGRWLREDWPYN